MNSSLAQPLLETPRRILILDDQPFVAEAMAMSLRANGFAVRSFTSARQALENIENFDVLITDYHMPEMTGLEVAKEAHTQGWRGCLLLMSGHRQILADYKSHPLFQSVLLKPFPTAELVRILRELT
ncbi:MAG TPA: response regulator [Candidatus Methylacidiphilales bacterium]|nr:response regulator [Candidatus Methylacidiphilales bacterium]